MEDSTETGYAERMRARAEGSARTRTVLRASIAGVGAPATALNSISSGEGATRGGRLGSAVDETRRRTMNASVPRIIKVILLSPE
jgi:hypothetical protein